MGLLNDRESDLPPLQRLIVRLQDATRRRDLPVEEWPTALVAYALHISEDPALLGEESLAIYADFVTLAPVETRKNSLSNLAGFVTRRRGAGWRALLLYAMGETTCPELCARAATLAISLAPPVEGQPPLVGASAVAGLLAAATAPPAMLSALLSLPDLRLLPALQPLLALPLPRMRALLAPLSCTLNTLSSAFLLQALETRPADLADHIVAALVRLATRTPLVADIALPLPTWAYTAPTPQPLHAWSLPEYLPRILPRLQPHLTPAQLSTLHTAFTTPR